MLYTHIRRDKILSLCFYGIIFLPTFPNILSNKIGLLLATAIIIGLVILMYICKVYKITPTYYEKTFTLCFILLTIIDLFADIITQVAIVNDFFELIKPLSFLLYYCVFRYSNRLYLREQYYFIPLYNSFIILSIYCILEFFIPTFFRPISLFLWKYAEQRVLIDKAIGSFFTTYNFAYILMAPLFISFVGLLLNVSLKNVLVFLMLLFTLLLAQSKSMYACSVIGLIFCLFLPFNYCTTKKTIKLILVSVICIVSIITFYYAYETEIRMTFLYAIEGIERISEGESGSTQIRMEQILWAITNNRLFLIGNGIGKGEILLESLYALYYYRYGLIGLTLFMFLCIFAAYKAYVLGKYFWRYNSLWAKYYYGISVFYLMTPIGTMSSCHQDMPKVSFIFYAGIGLIMYRSNSLKKDIIKSKNRLC